MKKMRSTQEVLDHHLKAFGDRDLDATLSDYATDAIVFTAEGPLKGHAAITPLFRGFFAEFGKPGLKFTMKRQTVEGDYAYLLWTADTADNIYEMATDAFVIRNGKIVAHFIAAKATPRK
jgi:ketosteroid isomerase-like protein